MDASRPDDMVVKIIVFLTIVNVVILGILFMRP